METARDIHKLQKTKIIARSIHWGLQHVALGLSKMTILKAQIGIGKAGLPFNFYMSLHFLNVLKSKEKPCKTISYAFCFRIIRSPRVVSVLHSFLPSLLIPTSFLSSLSAFYVVLYVNHRSVDIPLIFLASHSSRSLVSSHQANLCTCPSQQITGNAIPRLTTIYNKSNFNLPT